MGPSEPATWRDRSAISSSSLTGTSVGMNMPAVLVVASSMREPYSVTSVGASLTVTPPWNEAEAATSAGVAAVAAVADVGVDGPLSF